MGQPAGHHQELLLRWLVRIEELLLVSFEAIGAGVPCLHSDAGLALPSEELLLEQDLLLGLGRALLVALGELVELNHSLLLEHVPIQREIEDLPRALALGPRVDSVL